MSGGASVADVLAAVRLGYARLAPETAGYLALGLADLLAAEPQAVDERSCGLTDDGHVALAEGARAGTHAAPDGSVRTVLGALLAVASGGSAPSLAAVAGRGGSAGMKGLVGEIEAALIPVNRAAGRRALARLARETMRARDTGLLTDSVRPPDAVEPARPPGAVEPARLAEPSLSAPAPDTTPLVDVRAIAAAERRLVDDRPSRADELLASFTASAAKTDAEVARDLKSIAGMDPTPAPARVYLPSTPPPPVTDATPSSSDATASVVSAGDVTPPRAIAEAGEVGGVDAPTTDAPAGPPAPRRAWGVVVLVVLALVAGGAGWAVATHRLVVPRMGAR